MANPIKTPKAMLLEMAGIPHLSAGKRALDLLTGGARASKAKTARQNYENLLNQRLDEMRRMRGVDVDSFGQLPGQHPPVQAYPLASPITGRPNMATTQRGQLVPVPEGTNRLRDIPQPSEKRAFTQQTSAYPSMDAMGTEQDPFVFKQNTGRLPAGNVAQAEGPTSEHMLQRAGQQDEVIPTMESDDLMEGVEGEVSPMFRDLIPMAAAAERAGARHNYTPYEPEMLYAYRDQIRKALGNEKYRELMDRAGLWNHKKVSERNPRGEAWPASQDPESLMQLESYKNTPIENLPEGLRIQLQEIMQGKRHKTGGMIKATLKRPEEMRAYVRQFGNGLNNAK